MGCYLPYLFKSYAGVHVMIAVVIDWSWALMLGSGIYVRADDRKTSSENMHPAVHMIYFGFVETSYDSCWTEGFVVYHGSTKCTNIIHGDCSSRVAQHSIVDALL